MHIRVYVWWGVDMRETTQWGGGGGGLNYILYGKKTCPYTSLQPSRMYNKMFPGR